MAEEIKENEKVFLMKTDITETNDFRVVQLGDKEFVVQRKFIHTTTKGNIFSRYAKTTIHWKRTIDRGTRIHGYSMYHFALTPPMKAFKSLKKAKKWIDDFKKYPIYHDLKRQ